MRPLVSILIPVFNCKSWVGQSIRSALAQTWSNKELIVLDDGSTDGSGDVVREFGSQLQFETAPNCGQNISRNHLTSLSRGEWLVYLDADDELAPDSVAKKMACAEQADAVYGTIEVACY